jgi:hypothetical protein
VDLLKRKGHPEALLQNFFVKDLTFCWKKMAEEYIAILTGSPQKK